MWGVKGLDRERKLDPPEIDQMVTAPDVPMLKYAQTGSVGQFEIVV
jgi:hypothetical protein